MFYSLFDLYSIDGKLRTNHATESAVHTHLRILDFRRMVSLDVEFIGKDQNVIGTILDAKTASFAPILDDDNFATWRGWFFQTKRFFSDSYSHIANPFVV